MANCPTQCAQHQIFPLFYYLSCTHASLHLAFSHAPSTSAPHSCLSIHPASLTQTCTCPSMCPFSLQLPIHPPSRVHVDIHLSITHPPLNHICIHLPRYPSVLHPPTHHPPSLPFPDTLPSIHAFGHPSLCTPKSVMYAHASVHAPLYPASTHISILHHCAVQAPSRPLIHTLFT